MKEYLIEEGERLFGLLRENSVNGEKCSKFHCLFDSRVAEMSGLLEPTLMQLCRVVPEVLCWWP